MTQLLEFLADKLPTQDQRNLSFSSHQPKAFRDWADALPVVNVGETAKLLYQGIQELCHLKASAAHRLQLLELMRPKIHYTTDALKQHYSHQPILLSEKARKVANLCQALQKHLAVGYKVCLISALDGGFLGTAKEHIPTAMHRFLSELVFILLRCYQLYHPAIPMLWFEINLIYALAEERALLDHCLDDDEIDSDRAHSISDLYKKAVILATCKPNQLQAEDLENIFFASNSWSNLAAITQDQSRSGLFAAVLNTDTPPVYLKNLQDQHHHIRYIDMRNVIKHLEAHQKKDSQSRDRRFKGLKAEFRAADRAHISYSLCQHLVSAWGRTSKRSNERPPETGPVEATLGMSSSYEHLRVLQDFHSKATPPPSADMEDDNVINLDAEITRHISRNRQDQQLERYTCKLVNISARGVCLAWQQHLPMQLKNGELVMLRQEDKNEWLLGSISWTRHFHGEGVRTGIHLFSPNMVAVKVKLLRDCSDQTDWLPAILLPPPEIGAQPSLLTANAGFRQGSQLLLNYNGESIILLDKVLRQSTGFAEFAVVSEGTLFGLQDKAKAQTAQKTKPQGDLDLDDDLEGLWNEL